MPAISKAVRSAGSLSLRAECSLRSASEGIPASWRENGLLFLGNAGRAATQSAVRDGSRLCGPGEAAVKGGPLEETFGAGLDRHDALLIGCEGLN